MTLETETYQNSEVCQKCAKCCKAWWYYTTSKNEATRFSWLDTDKVSVTKINKNLWKITIDIPCKQLIEKDGKYWCKKYDSRSRPGFCRTYPVNLRRLPEEIIEDIIEEESKYCSVIKEALGVQDEEAAQ